MTIGSDGLLIAVFDNKVYVFRGRSESNCRRETESAVASVFAGVKRIVFFFVFCARKKSQRRRKARNENLNSSDVCVPSLLSTKWRSTTGGFISLWLPAQEPYFCPSTKTAQQDRNLIKNRVFKIPKKKKGNGNALSSSFSLTGWGQPCVCGGLDV